MQQGGGGSQYGVSPEMAPFTAAAATTTAAASTRTLVLGGVGVAAAATEHHHHHHHHHLKLGDPALAVAEEASPISSRPPAHSSAVNFDELLPVGGGGGGLPDEDALAAAADDGDRGGVAGGNRWPRQETLALLKIRSEMDVAFRDATLKGPLWEDVSRKLAELGYTRSAKKCKEKFENVHKYYKRTKEGRAGRQDGKSYRFFTQLEALHNTATSNVSPAPATPLTTVTAPPTTNTTSASTTVSPPTNLIVAAAPISIGIASSNPIPVSSVRIPSATMGASPMFPPDLSSGMISAPPVSVAAAATATATVPAAAPTAHAALGISFSSNTSSSSSGTDDDEPEDDDIFQGEPSNADSSRFLRKRKRGSSGGSSDSRRMMDFFESLMKQVMEKQEVMQQRFLETIEKREQDRMIREEAWKRQEMARLSREHDLMAQERAISASRDAAIIAFLQKITGQTIQLPTPVTIPAAPPPPAPAPAPAPVPPPGPPTQHHHHHQPQPQQQQPQPQQQQQHHHHHQQQQQTHHIHHQQHQSQSTQVVVRHQPSISSEVVMAIPEQQVPPQEMSSGGGLELSSSRWPKAEVLALIKLRSGLDSRYQEAGPKGPLWEEISGGMLQMGYKRSAKRCKEKWENINKYFKKVKESNKKRPEDAKTCPYFHQLDALYRQKLLGSTSGSGGSASGSYINPNRPEEQQQPPQLPQLSGAKLDPTPTPYSQDRSEAPPPAIIPPQVTTSQGAESESKNGTSSDEQTNNGGLPGSLFGEGSSTPKKPEDIVKDQQVVMEEYDNAEELDSDNMDQEEEDDEEEEDDDESEEERKIGYKIEFQRQNAGSSNGGGNGTTPSFLAVVQ